jgi:hypothetical protein
MALGTLRHIDPGRVLKGAWPNDRTAAMALQVITRGAVKAWPGKAGARGKPSATASLDGPLARGASALAQAGTKERPHRHEQRNCTR